MADAPASAALKEVCTRLLSRAPGMDPALAAQRVIVYGGPGQAFPESVFHRHMPPDGKVDRVVVLWGQTPADPSVAPVSTTPLLDPIALAYVLAPPPAGKDGRQVQIVVLDLGLDPHPRSAAMEYAMARRHIESAWLRVFPIGELDTFSQAISRGLGAATEDPRSDVIRELLLAGLFGEQLDPTRGSSHHALANLIGPQSLLEAMGKQGAEGHRVALSNLVRALGVGQPRKPNARLASTPWIGDGLLRRLEGLNVWLIDDMAHLGWSDFLRHALGLRNLEVHRDPFRILEAVSRAAVSHGLRGCGLGLEPEPDLLFLDLRLFADNDLSQRRAFYRSCLELVAAEIAGSSDCRGFGREDLEVVEDWIAEDRTPKEPYQALALLPLLLSISSPRLPIILFSSAGQKALVPLLSDCGTILTSFDKPRYWGPRTRLKLCRSSLVRSVEQALRIRAALIAPKREMAVTEAARTSTGEVVEIYVDESLPHEGSPFRRIGGLMAIYPDAAVADRYSERLVQSGIAIGFSRETGPTNTRGPDEIISKRPARNVRHSCLEQAFRIASEEGVRLVPCVISRPESYTSTSLRADLRPDNEQRELLEAFLESVLFGPNHLQDEIAHRACFSVYIATRQVAGKTAHDLRVLVEGAVRYGLRLWLPQQDEDETLVPLRLFRCEDVLRLPLAHSYEVAELDRTRPGPNGEFTHVALGDALRRLDEAGAPTLSRKWLLLGESFGADAVHPILQQLTIAHGYEWPAGLLQARCVQLAAYREKDGSTRIAQNFGRTTQDLPRQVHLLADWIVGMQPDELPQGLRSNGSWRMFDGDLKRAIQVCRALDREPSASAIVRWSRLSPARPYRGWLLGRVRRAKAGLDLHENIRLGQMINDIELIESLT
jgi:hypothetical protein